MANTEIKIGQKYPGAIPENDGPILEMTPDGHMILLLQIRNPSPAETKALEHGFTDYSIYQDPNGMAIWVFKYPHPINYMDTCFHAGLYEDDRANKFITSPFNILQVHMLNGPTVINFTLSFISHAALKLLQHIVAKQVAAGKISTADYNEKVADIYRLAPGQIFQLGSRFTHGENK